ncbi:uncharacterized protein [Rutidosis leptorrhynchoides]|uniref:uncharacterized protein n=1 Tax=Rutidosis leptorrhynchoides TaxID=125765 RepID=UPI003A996290
MVMKLFDDSGSDSDGGSGDISKIQINDGFARRYEHNKKREDLQRFEELKKKGLIDSDDDESSEDDEDIVNFSSKHDLKFFDALIKVRNQDPSLKNTGAKLFDSDNDDYDDNEASDEISVVKEKKKNPMYLKDVTAKHLLEEGPEFEDENDSNTNNNKKSYIEEQEALRKEFLDAVGDEEVEGDIIKVKEGNNKGDDDDDEDDSDYVKKLDEYFKEDDKLDEKEKFLKEYFRKKMWLEKDKSNRKVLDVDDGIDFSEDEEELDKQEDFERSYNFSHEENAGDRVMGYSRTVNDSVRKKDNARSIHRKNKEERMARAEIERKEELKRLKNLKKKEINEKIRKFRETAGIGEDVDCVLDERDIEEDFDPEEYDRKMKKAFDDKFYEAEDVDPEFGSEGEDCELKKPNFDEEDDMLGLPKGWEDEFGSDDGFLGTRKRFLKSKVNNNGGHEEQTQDKEETVVLQQGKKRKRKSSELEKEVVEKELEEYYKLDYEGSIGDLKTRFKYRPVNKNNYGLKAKEILVVDDKELNQLVPLKKLATYREDEFVVPRKKIKEQKQRIKSLLKGESSNGPNNGSKRVKHDVDEAENEKSQLDAQSEDPKPLSRKQRRKNRLNELKLSTSRLIAYQKLQPKSKNKKKNKS